MFDNTTMVKLHLLLLCLNLASAWNDCVFITECPVALKYIEKKRNDPQTVKILRDAHCGLVNTGKSIQAKVYCDGIPDFEESKQSKNTSKMALLPGPNECGVQVPVFRITRGQIADFEDYPWLALFRYKNNANRVTYQCHGTLISKRYVVTAAHCLNYPSALRDRIGNLNEIVLGEHDIRTELDCLPQQYGGYCADAVQVFLPESVHVHSKFGSSNEVSDIGLIRLNRDAVFSDYVKPICLLFNHVDMNPGQLLQISGWGKTENRTMSNVKLKAKIFLRSKSNCGQFSVDFTQICAGSSTGEDTCKGDSGGPLMLNRKLPGDQEARSFLLGIVSYGGRCGSGYAIYTNVTTFTDWILDTMYQ